jgi:LysM repeat protein
MRRSALTLSLVALGIGATGCSLFHKKNPDAVSDSGLNDGIPTGGTTYPTDSTYTAPAPSGKYGDPAGGKYHTVQKKETLYSLARSYYNDQSKWRVIYEANRADIGEDPNRIRVGQKLVIP